MAPARPIRPLGRHDFARSLKTAKPILLSETGAPSRLAPNIRSITWSPTGSLIATSISANVRIWNPERSNVKSSTELRNAGGVGMVERVGFCPTHESVLVSTGVDGMCRLWDVRVAGGAVGVGKGTKLAECKTGDTGLFLTWHPDGKEVLIGRKDDVVQAVDVRRMVGVDAVAASWEMEATDRTPVKDMGQFNAMAFSNSGRELFATTGDGPVKVMDYPSLEVIHTLDAHTSATYAVQHSPVGTYVAVGGSDSLVTLWDTTHWHCAHNITSHSGSVRDLSFSFDGAYIVASSGTDARDGSPGIHVSHVDTGELVYTVETANPVTWIAWHPLRYFMAYAGDPGGLKIIGVGQLS